MGQIVKRNSDLFPSLPGIFDDFITRDVGKWNDFNFTEMNSNMPAVNVKETDHNFHIEVAAPGYDKADFDVNVDNNLLTISTESRNEKNEKGEDGKYTRREFSYKSFKRSFSLPKDIVDSEKIEAKYVDGILQIDIPKKDEAKPKPPKSIKIG